MIANEAKSVLERAMDAERKPLSQQAAQEILQWHLTAEDDLRMRGLEEKSRLGTLTEEEVEDLREFCTTIDLLSLMHLRAKESLGMLQVPGE
jgi:hypothetical protein